MRREQIGIASLTVRGEVDCDVIGTLHRLAAMGYRAVEFAGIGSAMPRDVVAALGLEQWVTPKDGELTPRDVRAAMDDVGMRAASMLTGFPAEHSWKVLVEYVSTLGAQYVVLPWAPEELRRSADDVQRLAVAGNSGGRSIRWNGVVHC